MQIERLDEETLRVTFPGLDRVRRFSGVHDRNLRLLEDGLDLSVHCRGNEVYFRGNKSGLEKADNLLDRVGRILEERPRVTGEDLRLLIDQLEVDGPLSVHSVNQKGFMTTNRGSTIRPRTDGQAGYIRCMESNVVTVAVGPAGTGKTYLAVAYAVSKLRAGDVERIIITRPVVEAGEKLGFLPGDLKEKVDPYFRPLYDALFEMLGPEKVNRYIDRSIIEIAPLAYMRGRTLNNAFVILDEAQNTTRGQMKMFLTRIGEHSRAIITGDRTQIDLPDREKSGLWHIAEILDGLDEVAIVKLKSRDVIRHELVRRIIDAYDRWEQAGESRE